MVKTLKRNSMFAPGTPNFNMEINGTRVGFVHIPKCGGTSVKTMMLEAAGIDWKSTPAIDWGIRENERMYTGHDMHVWRSRFRAKLNFDAEVRIAVIRDPVERIRSAYTNRILYHQKMSCPGGIDELIHKLPNRVNPDLLHHTMPMLRFLGQYPESFTHIFTTKEIDKVADLLSEISGKKVPNIKRQTGGSEYKDKIQITQDHINKIKHVYADDYKFWWNKKVVPQAFQ